MTKIRFQDITFPLKKPVINNLSSSIKSNKLTAIIGPSGSGKTTLIKILSGRFTNKYKGTVYYNNQTVSKKEMLKESVFVHQDDILLPFLTVNETISFYESLRNRKSSKNIELEHIMNNYVGTSLNGISAGERKRLSILIGMIDNANLIFHDEPTSGLDSLNAHKMIQVFKEMTGTRICVLHQPSAEMFFLFDEIIVLNHGNIVYQDAPNNIFQWFSQMGIECPKYFNPSDFIFTHALTYLKNNPNKFNVSVRKSEEAQNDFFECSTRRKNNSYYKHTSWLNEFQMLFKRNVKSFIRDKTIGFVRVFQAIFVAIVVSSLYYGTYKMEITSKEKNISGILYIYVMNAFYISAMSSIPALYKSQDVLLREYQAGYYRYSSFYVSNIVSETALNMIYVIINLPITCLFIGYDSGFISYFKILLAGAFICLVGHSLAVLSSAICPNVSTASAALPAFMMPLTLLNGVLIDTNSVSSFFKKLQYISPTRYALYIMMKTEFDLFPSLSRKEALLEWNMTIKQSFFTLFIIYTINILLAFLLLRRKINKKI